MTTIDAAAAQRWHPKMALAVLVALAGLGLAGCETSTSLFGWNTPAAPETVVPHHQPAALTAAGESDGGANHRRAGCDRQTDPAGIHERGGEAARLRDFQQGGARRLHAARLHRRRQGQVRHQGVLHLGCHRPIRQARQPHHRRGGRFRQCHQGPLGSNNAAGGAVHRRQGRQLLRGLAAEPGHWGSLRTWRSRRASARRPRAAAAAPLRRREARRRRQATARRDGGGCEPDDRQHRPRRSSDGHRAHRHRRAGRRQHVADGRDSARADGQGRLGRRQADAGCLSRRRHGHGGRGQGRQAADPHRVAGQRSAGQEARHGFAAQRDPRRLARRRLGPDGDQAAGRRRPGHRQAAAAAQNRPTEAQNLASRCTRAPRCSGTRRFRRHACHSPFTKRGAAC